MNGRVLTVENATDERMAFALCRKRDGCLHLHIVNPDEGDEIHGDPVYELEHPPDMRTFVEKQVNEVDV